MSQTNNTNKSNRDLYIGINDFKKGHQHEPNLVIDENVDPLADSQNIFKKQKNYFCQLLNVHGFMMLGR
jgi:hypothetical protein